MRSTNTFTFPGYRTDPTNCTEDYYPAFFLCDYSTCSINLLANAVCWSTELPPAHMKRIIIRMHLISPAWLRGESSFPLEETREDNNRHGGDSLMSNCLEKTARRMEYYEHLLLPPKYNLIYQKGCEIGCCVLYVFLLPNKADALFSPYAPKQTEIKKNNNKKKRPEGAFEIINN